MKLSSNFKVAIFCIIIVSFVISGIFLYASQLINTNNLKNELSNYNQMFQAQIKIIKNKIVSVKDEESPSQQVKKFNDSNIGLVLSYPSQWNLVDWTQDPGGSFYDAQNNEVAQFTCYTSDDFTGYNISRSSRVIKGEKYDYNFELGELKWRSTTTADERGLVAYINFEQREKSSDQARVRCLMTFESPAKSDDYKQIFTSASVK